MRITILVILLLYCTLCNSISIESCNILSLSGGGSFGALEIGILSSVTNSHLHHYKLMTGVSVGGLNVGYLSYFRDINEGIDKLRDIYINMKDDDVYRFNFIERNRLSFYDTTPLRNTIKKILQPLGKQVIPAIVGSSNLYTGYMDIFNLEDYNLEEKVKVLMTTSAIPIVFPPIELNNSLYVDGGIISNSIINGVEHTVKCDTYEITYISTATPLEEDGTNNITNIYDYTKRVLEVVKYDFNNELAEIRNFYCSPKTTINTAINKKIDTVIDTTINNKIDTTINNKIDTTINNKIDTTINNKIDTKININYCYPTYNNLYKYSILDFTKGRELFNIGQTYNNCTLIQLC
jgi:NTE family protein